MKLVILIALIALAAAAPVDDKKPAEDKKTAEKTTEDKKPAADDKKQVEKPAEEKKDDDRRGLQWPLPDWSSEGDLMLHGVHLFDRVNELRKAKLENDMDKMVLSVGREYLRKVHKYIEKTPEFKILPILCRDSDRLNSTDRWVIRIRPEQQSSEAQDGQQEKQTAQGEQQQSQAAAPKPSQQQQKDAPPPKDAKQNDQIQASNSTHENATDAPKSVVENYETERVHFYERMGENFARVLLKRYRKEKLDKEETEYLDHWLAEESVHYGVMGIFCHDGENIKEIAKRISTFIDEKQQ